MLHFETLDPGTLRLLKELMALPLLKDTRLVGGTALALQLGHRNSIDLDLFGSVPFSSDDLHDALAAGHSLTVIKESASINIYLIDGVKVDVVNYRYPWIGEAVPGDGFILAGIADIAAMKISAIVGRGTKKDFIDLFFLIRIFPLRTILDFYMKKFEDASIFIAMKSLTYFEDAEADPMPTMLEDISWEAVKEAICNAVINL